MTQLAIPLGPDLTRAQAEAILEHFVGEKLFARAAALRYRVQQPHEARKLLERGLGLFPESSSLRAMQS